MKLRALSALLIAATMLPLTGCIAGFTYDRGPHVPTIYLDYNIIGSTTVTPEIVSYPSNGSGSVTPGILADTPGSTVITAVAVDRSGYIYAGIYDGSGAGFAEIVVFAPGATGSDLPIRSFYPAGITSVVEAITIDPSGNVYTADRTGDLFKFGPTASGSTAPLLLLTGYTFGGALATDASGDLYFSIFQGVNDEILVYNAGFTSYTPSRTIIPPVMEYIDGLAVDASGNIYASGELIAGAGTGRIDVYASNATGFATPTRTIAGSATLLAGNSTSFGAAYNSMALDGAGNIYTRSIDYVGSGTILVNTINKYSPTATGNVAPVSTITTNLTTNNNVDIALY
jgi:hypothetical protein